ncbi:MAG: hypothetical protein LBO69_06010 [Ignavibacteria bacterium]|jgi:hypothetical protein|nr:hypothetical protein [Ignavibacteria bacterium]
MALSKFKSDTLHFGMKKYLIFIGLTIILLLVVSDVQAKTKKPKKGKKIEKIAEVKISLQHIFCEELKTVFASGNKERIAQLVEFPVNIDMIGYQKFYFDDKKKYSQYTKMSKEAFFDEKTGIFQHLRRLVNDFKTIDLEQKITGDSNEYRIGLLDCKKYDKSGLLNYIAGNTDYKYCEFGLKFQKRNGKYKLVKIGFREKSKAQYYELFLNDFKIAFAAGNETRVASMSRFPLEVELKGYYKYFVEDIDRPLTSKMTKKEFFDPHTGPFYQMKDSIMGLDAEEKIYTDSVNKGMERIEQRIIVDKEAVIDKKTDIEYFYASIKLLGKKVMGKITIRKCYHILTFTRLEGKYKMTNWEFYAVTENEGGKLDKIDKWWNGTPKKR